VSSPPPTPLQAPGFAGPTIVPAAQDPSKLQSDTALGLAINRHLQSIPEAQRERYRGAAGTLTEKNLFDNLAACDENHKNASLMCQRSEALQNALRFLDRFMNSIAIIVQANPDISSIVVDGARIVLDVAIGFL